MRHRSAPAVQLAIISHQPVTHGFLGGDLQRRIEAGTYHQPALRRHVLAELLDQFLTDLLGEPLGAGHRRRTVELGRDDRLGLRCARLRYGDRVIVGHAVQHPVAPRLRRLGEFERVVVVRRLRQGSQERRFRHGELVEPLVEIRLRCRRHAVRAEAEIDLVQVQLQHALLRHHLFDPHRQQRLADLTAHRHFVVIQQHVLGDLLGDGGGTDRPPPRPQMHQVEHPGAGNGQRIDAAVAPEILVLGGNESLLDHVGNGLNRHENPALGRQFRHHPPVAGEHSAHHRRLVVLQSVHVRQVGAEMAPGDVASGRADRAAQHDDAEQGAEHAADEAGNWVASAARRWRRRLTPGTARPGMRGQRLAGSQGTGHVAAYEPFREQLPPTRAIADIPCRRVLQAGVTWAGVFGWRGSRDSDQAIRHGGNPPRARDAGAMAASETPADPERRVSRSAMQPQTSCVAYLCRLATATEFVW